jgi:anti-sigma factor ChrR (cupin superfamily)
MKIHHGWMATAMALALLGTPALGAGVQAQEPPPQDTRHTIELPEPARQTVLHEMRLMLTALHGVLASSVDMDRDRMAEEALSGGTRIAVDTDPAVARRLPDAFIRLGSSTHEAFDDLAEAIRAGAGRDSVMSRLGTLTSKCVSCHASYRVVTPDEPAGN